MAGMWLATNAATSTAETAAAWQRLCCQLRIERCAPLSPFFLVNQLSNVEPDLIPSGERVLINSYSSPSYLT